MAIVIIALTMATAMMVAAFQAAAIERRAEMFRTLRASSRGHFESDRN
jgi:hypothetical protein